jgi:ATP-dependent exoDNAse (exonuclease V) beta subunit
MFTVLRSSAGAGKTHALVKHYLEHALRLGQPGAYRHVLALTFTNKAASEMKERVTAYLGKLAVKDLRSSALQDVMEHLKRKTGGSEDQVAQAAEAALHHMLHHWAEVAISTIDAFTRRVVRPFARDLQLDQALRMSTEQSWYRDRAVDALIAQAGQNQEVTHLLTEACRQLLEEEARWDAAHPLRALASELDKESSMKPLDALHGQDSASVSALSDRLRRRNAAFKEEVRAAGRDALRILAEAGLEAEDLAYASKGILSWFRKLADFGPEWLTPGSNALKTVESGKWHGSKADAATIARVGTVSGRLADLFERSRSLCTDGQRDYFIRRAVLRELPAAFALRELQRCLEEQKAADGVVFFSDLTRRVAGVVQEEPVPYIHERIGERYRHFLIDEFQDTSLLQWRCLLPLIDNALSTGGSALLVGDAKQAIYRWRNGEVRLFTHLPGLFGAEGPTDREREATLKRYHREGEPLVANYRSAGTIVAFNNRLFEDLAGVLPESLRSVYADQAQESKRQEAGYIRITIQETEGEADGPDDPLVEFAERSVKEALADGFAPESIAVLVRSKAVGKRVADHLLALGHAVSSPDGAKLAGDPATEAIVDLLRVLHTGDEAAAARFLQLQAKLSATADTEWTDPFASLDGASPLARVRTWLAAQGNPSVRTTLTALIADLAHALGLPATDDACLLTLRDEAHAFGLEHGQDVGGFLAHWERTGGERSASGGTVLGAIQVMTIHKAKGLQFPVVVVPTARMGSGNSNAERLWVNPAGVVPELASALIRPDKSVKECGLPELEAEAALRLLDDLDLLYVAFTRPEQRLYALVPTRKPDELTARLLEHLQPMQEGAAVTLGERLKPWPKETAEPPEALRAPERPNEPALPLRLEAPADWVPDDPDPLRRFGNLVHDLLGRVEHAEALPQAVAALLREGLVNGSEARTLEAWLGPAIRSDGLRPWFGPGLHVRTEASIITADGHAQRPDRIVSDGGVMRVLDIKTGAPSDRHHDQVRGYMRLLRELGHDRVEGALFYVRDGSVIPVEAA